MIRAFIGALLLGLFFILLGSSYIMLFYHVESYFQTEFIITAYIIGLPLIIFSYIRTPKGDNNDSEEKEKGIFTSIKNFLGKIFSPLLFVFIMEITPTYLHAYFWGHDIYYKAIVYERREGGKSRSEIKIKSENSDETLKGNNLYYNTRINSELLIRKRVSALGSFIEYSDVAVLKY